LICALRGHNGPVPHHDHHAGRRRLLHVWLSDYCAGSDPATGFNWPWRLGRSSWPLRRPSHRP